MCAGAIVLARVPRVVYGTADPKAGAAGSVLDVLAEPRFNHRPEVEAGVLQPECAALLARLLRRAARRRRAPPDVRLTSVTPRQRIARPIRGRSRMRALGRVSIAGVLLCLAFAGPAAADGPGVGTPTVVTLGDSAISGEAGRWAGNTNMAAWRVDALGSDRVLGRAERRGDPRLPPLQGRAGAHRRRRREPEPRLLGREDVDGRDRLGRGLQARHRLLHRPEGRRPGARAPGVRQDAQRQDRRRDDRGQQLRLRGDRRALRDQLGHVAVVVEELLLRRLRHDVALHRDAAGDGDGERARARCSGSPRR